MNTLYHITKKQYQGGDVKSLTSLAEELNTEELNEFFSYQDELNIEDYLNTELSTGICFLNSEKEAREFAEDYNYQGSILKVDRDVLEAEYGYEIEENSEGYQRLNYDLPDWAIIEVINL